MRRTRVLHCALAAVLVVVLGGCGGDDTPIRTVTPQITASSPSPDLELAKDDRACKLLSPKERESIAGQPLDIVSPSAVIKGGLVCRWVDTLKTPSPTSIKLSSQPLQTWVRGIPKHIETLQAGGRYPSKYSKRLQDAKKEILRAPEKITDKRACEFFKLLVASSQGKKFQKREGILFQGTQSGDYLMSWQRCGEGIYTEIVYQEPGLQVSLALAQAVIRLGKLAHKRAAKIINSE